MTFRKVFTAAVAGTALVAANITAFAGGAQAESWHRNGPGQYRSDRDWDGGGRRNGYDYGRGHYKRDKSDKKVARGIAIGLGVLLLGSILASEANRH
jgi:hypothetical protein